MQTIETFILRKDDQPPVEEASFDYTDVGKTYEVEGTIRLKQIIRTNTIPNHIKNDYVFELLTIIKVAEEVD